MIQQLVESQADGWTHATDEVGRFFDQVAGEAPRRAAGAGDLCRSRSRPTSPKRGDVMGGYLGTAETLGRRTAEMHLALAADSTDTAFAPEPFIARNDARRARWPTRSPRRTRPLQALEHRPTAGSSSPESPTAPACCCSSRETLFERIRSAPALRVHRLEDPGPRRLSPRPGALVRGGLLHPRLRGGAGALHRRSAARSSRRSRTSPACCGPSATRPTPGCSPTRRRARPSSSASNHGHTSGRPGRRPPSCAAISRPRPDASFLPADSTRTRDALLRLFVLDKALYELNYELNNRPDWVRIPLRGIFDLLRAGKT